MITPSPPRALSRRGRSHLTFIIVLAAVAAIGGCGSAAWYMGLFTSNGRFDKLDACTLLPPPTELAALVPNGAREPQDSRPGRTLFDDDSATACQWSSVPAGQDRPFRTVRVHTETKSRSGHVAAEQRAHEELATTYANVVKRRGVVQAKRLDLGEEGYRRTDTMEFQILFSRTVVYDLHVEFRISNALVDVSARTHTAPTDRESALVLELAKTIAERLDSTD